MTMAFNSHNGGYLYSRGGFESKWDAAAVPAADLYSNWVRVDSKDGHLTFHYHLDNDGSGANWVGTIRIESHNDPDETTLIAEPVLLSDGTTGVAVSSGVSANGVISVTKRTRYYRMFLDYTSGTADKAFITCQVHQ
jgi:hypothetical protein